MGGMIQSCAKKVLELFKLGKTPKQISEALKVSTATVYKHLKKNGARCKWSQIIRPKATLVIQLATSNPNWTLTRLSNVAGMTLNGASKVLKRHNIETTFRRGHPKGHRKETLKLAEKCRKWKQAGLSYTAIARNKLHGKVTRQWVQQAITNHRKLGKGTCPTCGQVKSLARHHVDYLNDIVVPRCYSCHRLEHTQ